ncbi:acyltransferase family protein [Longivirga aurantiaca]|uniref:Acyltransferase family protein n=1 Tax=Longivirga aurantiaca TaxID=1837743 RepID=A0ABW1SZT8_9ACTN
MTSSPTTARTPVPFSADQPRLASGGVSGDAVRAPRRRKHAGVPGAGSRIGGLDGLRAIAVTAVVIYHLGIEWLPGGFLGVDLFFVISGFLITTLLLAEVGVRGRIDFTGFYLRRARRLLPALVLMLVGTAILVSTVANDVAEQFLRDLPGAALYISNWWALGQEQSYFELIGRGNVLAHLWSLAVEEQFYLLWPVILGGLCWFANRRGLSRRRLVLIVALGGAVASTLWMSWLSISRGMPLDADPTRVYFGTDTHAMSVLLGAALATVWRPAHFRTTIPAGARTAMIGAGVVGLAMTAWLFVTITEYTPWLYRGGFLLAAAVFALVIASATHPGAPIGRLLDVAPMRWVGERSYGIYLWHWPILLVTRPGVDIPWEGPLVDVGRVALTLGVAALSYRYVEVPIRHGAIGKAVASMRERARTVGPVDAVVPRRGATIGTLLVTTAVAAALVASFATLPKTDPVAAAYGEYGSTEAISDDASPTAAPSMSPSTKPSTTPSSKPSTTPTPKPSASSKPPVVLPPGEKRSTEGLGTGDISWYGDSVTLWSADALRAILPGVKLDAAINRSPANMQDAVLASLARGTLRPIVVMHMGTAGPVSEDRLEATIAQLGDRTRIVLVTSTARFAWVKPSNQVMAAVASRHDNVVLADWRTYSTDKDGWFKDGLHLTEKGKPYFGNFVKKAALSN